MNDHDPIDHQIKQELASQAAELDKLVSNDDNFFTMVKGGFTSGMRHMVIITFVVAILLSVVMFYSGYQYFFVEGSDQAQWGMILLLSFIAQAMVKMWMWLEMNRFSQVKEIKRLQLYVKHLSVSK